MQKIHKENATEKKLVLFTFLLIDECLINDYIKICKYIKVLRFLNNNCNKHNIYTPIKTPREKNYQ